MIKCPRCGTENSDNTINCKVCNTDLSTFHTQNNNFSNENNKNIIQEPNNGERSLDTVLDQASKGLIAGPLFILIMALFGLGRFENFNLFSILSSEGAKQYGILNVIVMGVLLLLIFIILLGILFKYKKELYCESLKTNETNKILNFLNKFNSDKDLFKDGETTYYAVVMNSNLFNIFFIPLTVALGIHLFLTRTLIIGIIGLLFALITIALFVLIYVCPDKLNSILGEDIRSNTGFKKLYILAHLTDIFIVIMLVLMVL